MADLQKTPAPKAQVPNKFQSSEIDLVDLFFTLLEKWHLIVLFTLIGALIAGTFTFFFIQPTYESTAKLYIVSASGDSVVDLTDLNIGTNLTNDYQELIMSYPVLDRVISALKLDMNDEDLKRVVSIGNPANTRVITITAKTASAELSRNIANTMAGVIQEYLPETMSTVRPNVAQVARLASKKSGPSFGKNTVIGALLGFLAAAGYLTIRYLVDDTVRTAEDLERAFGIRPLTAIPENQVMHLQDNASRSRHEGSILFRVRRWAA